MSVTYIDDTGGGGRYGKVADRFGLVHFEASLLYATQESLQ
jgi:hypothetical protein